MWKIIFLLSLKSFLTFAHQNTTCDIHGRCYNSHLVEAVFESSKSDCILKCQENPLCLWFTFDPDAEFCELFDECNVIDEENCDFCVSGERNCQAFQCNKPGLCDGDLLNHFGVSDVGKCFSKCQEDSLCNWISFNEERELCLTFATCPAFNNDPENGFISSHLKCKKQDTFSKVIITAGTSSSSEIIDIENPELSCISEEYSFPRDNPRPFGALFNKTFPIVCGDGTRICYILMDGGWFETLALPDVFYGGAAIEVNETSILVTGGDDSFFMNLIPGDISSGPNIPTLYTCFAKVESKSLIMLMQYANPKVGTWMLDLNSMMVSDGPLLNKSMFNGCGSFKDSLNDDIEYVVSLDEHVEMLIFDRTQDEVPRNWTIGPEVPFSHKWRTHLVVSLESSLIILGGTYPYDQNDDNPSTDIYKLECFSLDCKWTLLEQKLQIPRSHGIALPLPDELAKC